MTPQLLIYQAAAAVSPARHGDVSVERNGRYGFSAKVNAVPLLGSEFSAAAGEYAIVFAGEGDALMPSVVLGFRGQHNAYLDSDAGWRAKYIPAFIRRYPYVFSKSADGQKLTLCVDESFSGFNREGRGQALFDAAGAPTAHVDGVLKFLQHYHAHFQRTRAFCDTLQALDLLEPMQAKLTLAGGETSSLSGFKGVNRARLKALSDGALTALFKSDELELVHLHLQSLRNFDKAREPTAAPVKAETDKPSAPVDAAVKAGKAAVSAGLGLKKRTRRALSG
jgi:hypothetical protein